MSSLGWELLSGWPFIHLRRPLASIAEKPVVNCGAFYGLTPSMDGVGHRKRPFVSFVMTAPFSRRGCQRRTPRSAGTRSSLRYPPASPDRLPLGILTQGLQISGRHEILELASNTRVERLEPLQLVEPFNSGEDRLPLGTGLGMPDSFLQDIFRNINCRLHTSNLGRLGFLSMPLGRGTEAGSGDADPILRSRTRVRFNLD